MDHLIGKDFASSPGYESENSCPSAPSTFYNDSPSLGESPIFGQHVRKSSDEISEEFEEEEMSTELSIQEIGKDIGQRIHFIRGHRVMLDSDLAELYGVKTRVLNQAVRRNLDRFPGDFMFELTREEFDFLMSRIVISKTDPRGGRQKTPLVFTEQGVAMLSSVLRSKGAVQVNIAIMRAFVKLREMLETNRDLAKKIDQLERKFLQHDQQFKAVFEAIRQLMAVGSPLAQKKIKGLS